jgi:fido (protein-threonine AMPylation protein)
LPDDGRPDAYAGLYRTANAYANFRDKDGISGKVTFVEPYRLETTMAEFVQDFNADMDAYEASGAGAANAIDAFYLAADVCEDFVCIHPFNNGNGRICRLLLNALLVRFAGFMAPIGETEADREEYLEIVQMATTDDFEVVRNRLAAFARRKSLR